MSFKYFISYLFLLFATALNAQSPEMADTMRSNGKIYVVVAVIALVFGGIVAYLVRLDRKISKLEKENNHQNKR